MIRPKKLDDWTVVPNLWATIVGPPGYLKTPMMAESLRPLSELEKQAREQYEAAYEKWRREKDAFEGAGKKGLNEGQLRARLEEFEQSKPEPTRFICNDPTIEKLTDLLKVNVHGMLLVRDELAGFLNTMDRQGHEGDRAFYLECWNGAGAFTMDRIGRGSVTAENLCLSIVGAMTPAPLTAYLREVFQGDRDDGLIQRFQLLVYPDGRKDWEDVDRAPNEEARVETWEVFKRFIDLGDRKSLSSCALPLMRKCFSANGAANWSGACATPPTNTPS
jgi:putative DNA primase/helicase